MLRKRKLNGLDSKNGKLILDITLQNDVLIDGGATSDGRQKP
jgi:hypothetical protein